MRIFGSNTRRLIQKMFMKLRLTCSIKSHQRTLSDGGQSVLGTSADRVQTRCRYLDHGAAGAVSRSSWIDERRCSDVLQWNEGEQQRRSDSRLGTIIIIYIYVKYFTSFESWILFDLPDPHLRSDCFSQLIWFKRLRLNLSLFNLELLFLSILLTN